MHEFFNFSLPPEKQKVITFYAMHITSQYFGKLKYTSRLLQIPKLDMFIFPQLLTFIITIHLKIF